MLVYQRVNHIQSWDVYHQLVQDFASFTIHGTVLWISLKETHADWTNGPGDFPWNPWDFFNWSNHVMGMGMSYNVMACGWLWSIHTIRIYQSILLGYIQLIPILWLCYALKRWDHVGRFFFSAMQVGDGDHPTMSVRIVKNNSTHLTKSSASPCFIGLDMSWWFLKWDPIGNSV